MTARRTKIVATLGPASGSEEILQGMIRAGVDVFRLNFSHGSHEEHETRIRAVREVCRAEGRHVALLGDLGGPKIRTGSSLPEGPVLLTPGQTVRLVPADLSVGDRIGLSHPEILDELEPGMDVYLADGSMRLRVEETKGGQATCRVVVGGRLGSRKGVNVPRAAMSSLPSLTDKDREDALWAAGQGLDYLALSFVRRPSDLEDLRSLLGASDVPILAKIEKPQAVERLSEILEVSDGVMVARGDLGVEMPLERLPLIQKQICVEARDAERPVIVATQMLESMVSQARPTRAEVSDVANAVFDGADAVMLSEETATGAHPVEVVKIMARILEQVDRYLEERRWHEPAPSLADADNVGEAVGRAAELVARQLGIRVICVLDHDGTRARAASASRPAARILGLSDSETLLRRMALLWGVEPMMAPEHRRGSQLAAGVRELLKTLRIPGESAVLLTGTPHDGPGPATTLRVVV